MLGTNACSHALDEFELGAVDAAVVAFISGGLYGLSRSSCSGFSRTPGRARRGLRRRLSGAHGRSGVRVVPLRCVARVVPADRGLRWRPVPQRRLATPGSGTTSSRRSRSRRSRGRARCSSSGCARTAGRRPRARRRGADRAPRTGCCQRVSSLFDVVGDGRDLGVAELRRTAARRSPLRTCCSISSLLDRCRRASADRALRVRGRTCGSAAAGRRKTAAPSPPRRPRSRGFVVAASVVAASVAVSSSSGSRRRPASRRPRRSRARKEPGQRCDESSRPRPARARLPRRTCPAFFS